MTEKNLADPVERVSVFARKLNMLERAGYTFEADEMVPPR